jgi:hypothetical protein
MNIIALVKRQLSKGKQPPELHACPHCGAALTRLHIIHGGIIRFGMESRVKATIACRDCKRIHVHRGNKVADHWLVMTILGQGRRVEV